MPEETISLWKSIAMETGILIAKTSSQQQIQRAWMGQGMGGVSMGGVSMSGVSMGGVSMGRASMGGASMGGVSMGADTIYCKTDFFMCWQYLGS